MAFLFGDVGLYANEMRDLSAVVRNRRNEQIIPEQGSVFAIVAQYRAHFFLACECIAHRG